MTANFDLNPRLPSKSDLEWDITNLREKLKRRNSILDTIRKAYHRDIVTVQECLHRIQNDENICISREIMANIEALPSLDVRRNIDLKLFGPDDCQLRLNGCYSCGGTLEIVHRENKRVKKLEALLEDTVLEAANTKENLDQTFTKLRALEDQSKREITIRDERIQQLLNQMDDYNFLKKDTSCRNDVISSLSSKLRDFESTKQALECSERMLSCVQMSREEMHQRMRKLEIDIVAIREERRNLTSELSELRADQLSRIESAKKLTVEFHSTKDDLRSTSADLANSQTEIERLLKKIAESTKEVSELKMNLSRVELKHNRTVTKMQQCQDGLMYELKNVRLELQTKSDELEKKSEELECLVMVENSSTGLQKEQEKEEQLKLEETASAQEMEMKLKREEILREVLKQLSLMLEISHHRYSNLLAMMDQCGAAVGIRIDKEAWKKSPAFEIIQKVCSAAPHQNWDSLDSFKTDQKYVVDCLRKRFEYVLNVMRDHINGLEIYLEQRLVAQQSKADALLAEARLRSSEKESVLNKVIGDMKSESLGHVSACNRLSKSYETLKAESGKLRANFSDLQIEYGKKQDMIAELADNASELKAQLQSCECRLSAVCSAFLDCTERYCRKKY